MLLVFIGLIIATTAQAQTTAAPNTIIKKSQLLVRPKDADGNIIITPFLENPIIWARDKQQVFSGTMRTALNSRLMAQQLQLGHCSVSASPTASSTPQGLAMAKW
jgi:hypothetical protein